MKKGLLLRNLIGYAWKVVCQQFWLLAVLSMLFFVFPLCAGPVAENILKDGVDFSGITLAVCAPEEDDTGIVLEEITSRMRDIRRYATLCSMERTEAFQALEEGRVTAVLLLPEGFINGILSGENPDVTVVVREDQPLEGLLTLWVGQCAADLLTTVQKGIYVVLDAVDQAGQDALQRDQAVSEINLVYINRSLNRQDLFVERALMPTGSIDIRSHYGLSLLIFLCLCLPPVFWKLFSGNGWIFRRRIYAVGCGSGLQMTSCWVVMMAIILPMTVIPLWLLSGWNVGGILIMALFACGYCSMCCLLSGSAAVCGCISMGCAAGMLFVSGGILPLPLMPEAVRRVNSLLPASGLREMLYLPYADWEEEHALVMLWIVFFFLLSWVLFRSRLRRGEGT